MHNIKKYFILTILCLNFKLTYSEQKHYSEFYNAELYSYEKNEIIAPAQHNVVENKRITISDTITNNSFTSGKTRQLITQVNEDGKTITSIETWTTKNPSYLTWQNAALLSAVTAAAIGSGLLFYNNLYPEELQSLSIIEIIESEPVYSNVSSEVTSLENQSPTIQDSSEIIAPEPTTQNTQTSVIENVSEDHSKQSDLLKSPLVIQWVQLEFSGDQLSPEQIQQLHALEAQPEFKKQLKQFTQQMSNPIDFDAPDDKKCSLCTRLREAYGRTAEDNKTPNYFD